MVLLHKLFILFKAVIYLGFGKIFHYSVYQIGLWSGIYRILTPIISSNQLRPIDELKPNWFIPLPDPVQIRRFGKKNLNRMITKADEICEGQIRLFGADPVNLNLNPKGPLHHWTIHEHRRLPDETDIKFTWEPARFNWAVTLGQAFHTSNDEKYAEAFWKYFEGFMDANPLNTGPNWQSGQEVALRLIVFVICIHFFRHSDHTSKNRMRAVVAAVADHAERILPTLSYAIAQDNNHLISEAAGLYTAGIFLANHPESKKWRMSGIKWFRKAILAQIDENGEYAQHSTNYHRMMLILALWMNLVLENNSEVLQDDLVRKLSQSVRWLGGYVDGISGRAANLGHNDGSNILQFAQSDYSDFRPILQAGSRAFIGKPMFNPGPWDDLCLWLDLLTNDMPDEKFKTPSSDHPTRIRDGADWSIIRAAHYTNRPGHADQLHVDIWHNGINIAQDAGTFRYNALPPWQNALAGTKSHNTCLVDDMNQMTRTGRFLWLDWAQARIIHTDKDSVTAVHDGYKKIGVMHKRTLERIKGEGWQITDKIEPAGRQTGSHLVQLHWLTPDYPFTIDENRITFSFPFGTFNLEFIAENANNNEPLNVIRAGKSLTGNLNEILLGWYSRTYGIKEPALSIVFRASGKIPMSILTAISIQDR